MRSEAARLKQAALAGLLFVSIFHVITHLIKFEWLITCLFLFSAFFAGKALLKNHDLLSKPNERLFQASIVMVLSGLFVGMFSQQGHYASQTAWLSLVIMASAILLPLRRALLINISTLLLFAIFSLLSGNALNNLDASLGLGIFTLLCAYVHQHVNLLAEQLNQSRTRDKLTNCILPTDFKHELDKAEQLFVRYGTPFTVVCLKYDNRLPTELLFDQWLQELVQVLKSRIRKTDILCRFNTQKLMLLLPSTSYKNAELLTHDLEQSLKVYEFSYKKDFDAEPQIEINIHAYPKDETLDTWFNQLQAS